MIKLNKDIYSIEAINKTIIDFKEFLNADTKIENNYYIIYNIKITDKEKKEIIKKEFVKYAFGLSQNLRHKTNGDRNE